MEIQKNPLATVPQVQSNLNDLKAQHAALMRYGLNDTSGLMKTSTGQYVPKTRTLADIIPESVETTQIPEAVDTGVTDTRSDFVKMLQGVSGNEDVTDPKALLASLYSKAYTPSDTETKLSKEVTKTTQMIDDLERDLTTRLSGAGPISSSFVNRELAVEQRPLTRQLAEQSQALGQEQSTRQSIANMIPSLISASEYQTPQDKLAAQIVQEMTMKNLGLGSYATTEGDTTTTLSPGQVIFDKSSGQPIYTAPQKSSTETQVVDVGGRKKLIDTATGQTISDLGVSTPSTSEIRPTLVQDREGNYVWAYPPTTGGGGMATPAGVLGKQTEGGGIPEAVEKATALQNAADTQTVLSNYETIRGITKKVGKTPETVTEKDIEKLSNADQVTVGRALARMQNPDISRSGGDAGNSFEEYGALAQTGHVLKQTFTGKLYDAKKVLEGIQSAKALYDQRITGTPETSQKVAEAGSVITYKGIQYHVGEDGEMTPVSESNQQIVKK